MSVAERPPADASGRGAAFHSPEAGEQLTVVEPLIFAASTPGRRAVRFPRHPTRRARPAALSHRSRQPPGERQRPRSQRSASSTCCATSIGSRTSTMPSTWASTRSAPAP